MAAPERQAAIQAGEGAREAEAYARLVAEGVMVPGEDRLAGEGPHKGHALHSHPWHGDDEMCSCGTLKPSFVLFLPPEPLPEPDPCPVCTARGIPFDGR
jgi:hypothetical protein